MSGNLGNRGNFRYDFLAGTNVSLVEFLQVSREYGISFVCPRNLGQFTLWETSTHRKWSLSEGLERNMIVIALTTCTIDYVMNIGETFEVF